MVTMGVSALARESGLSASTLRYYESLGLVTAMRAANGYRQYSEDALERLRLISAAKELRPSLRSVLYWKWEAGS